MLSRTEPSLPQPQYWHLRNHSIASVVGPTQPGYQWSADASIGMPVFGALPSGMPNQEVGVSAFQHTFIHFRPHPYTWRTAGQIHDRRALPDTFSADGGLHLICPLPGLSVQDSILPLILLKKRGSHRGTLSRDTDAHSAPVAIRGLPSLPMQKWLVLPLPAPSEFCAKNDQPSCRSTPYPVMIIREPTASDQVSLALSHVHVTVKITCNV